MATVDIVIPVYNEEEALPRSVAALHAFLQENLPQNPWRVIIADNGSTDSTLAIAQRLSENHSSVAAIHIPQKGRGRALRITWLESPADMVGYMDVDLSTDLGHLPQLVEAIERGYDIAIGSRLMRGSRVTRPLKREIISRCYNLLIRALFFTPFKDAQCGFKVVSRRTAQALVPLIKNNNWFFDTELLIIAAKAGLRIKEVPVRWVDDPGSRVKVFRTSWEDIKGLLRLRFRGIPRVPSPTRQGQRTP